MKFFAVLTFFCAIGLALSERPFHPLNAPFMPGSNQKIINGQEAVEGAWPWQVSLQRFNSHFCGGSLIAKGFVMSAAHCAVYQSGVTANMGSIEWANCPQKIAVTNFEQHSQYNDQTYDYDYSIVTLAYEASLDNNVALVDLVEAGVEYPAGTTAITTGWGYTIRFPATIPANLQVADIPLVSQSDCQEFWGSMDITDRMQCAAGNNDSSSCMGDSGGPLVVEDSSATSGYRLIGAVSWGSSTCSTSAPTAYAKISAVRGWIDGKIGNA